MLYIEGFFITCNRIIQNELTMSHLLDKPAREMLAEFGKGAGMKGAGATVALNAIAATQILISICKLTSSKEKYISAHATMKETQQVLENKYLPRLERTMQADATTVENMLRLRMLRDSETDPEKKQALKLQAAATLEGATVTMITLCTDCLEIIPLALEMHQIALKSAQGDTIMALNSLLAAATSGLYASLKNIQASKNAEWVLEKREIVTISFGRLHEYQYILSGKLAALYNNT